MQRVLLVLLFLGVSACGLAEEPAADDPEGPALQGESEQPRDARRARPVQQGDLADRIEDARLASRVLIALADDDQLRRFPFEVDAIRGQVHVLGAVPTLDLQRRVESVSSGVSGVRTVVNETVSEEVAPARPPSEASIAELPEVEVQAPEVASTQPPPGQEPTPEPPPAPETAEVFHTVRSGESLWTIARQHNTSIADIRRLNNMSSDNLRPGQRIRVR